MSAPLTPGKIGVKACYAIRNALALLLADLPESERTGMAVVVLLDTAVWIGRDEEGLPHTLAFLREKIDRIEQDPSYLPPTGAPTPRYQFDA
jgi:hypothetical protein